MDPRQLLSIAKEHVLVPSGKDIARTALRAVLSHPDATNAQVAEAAEYLAVLAQIDDQTVNAA